MLKLATAEMVPALTRIWETGFGDDPAYIRFFMEHRFSLQHTAVWVENDAPVGAWYFFPCTLGGKDAFYVYAAAVLPAWRGRGIHTQAVRIIRDDLKRRHLIFCFASAPHLHPYYRAQGFAETFYFVQRTWSAQGASSGGAPLRVHPAEAAEYRRLREAQLDADRALLWDEAAVAYALAEQRFSGGFADVLEDAQGSFVLFGHVEQNTLMLRETTLPRARLAALAVALCAHYGAEKLQAMLAAEPEDKDTQLWGFTDGLFEEEQGHALPCWMALDLT